MGDKWQNRHVIEPWRLEMLGGLAAVQRDRRITRFQTQKTGALLAYLALHPSRSISRESLAELLWPDGDPVAIRNRLNQAISSLRRQLHPPELGPGQVLITDHHSVGINAQAIKTDVQDFEREIKLAEQAESDEEKVRHLESAVALYLGELLDGYYEEWMFPLRSTLADQFDDALKELIRIFVRLGRPDRATEFARRRLATDAYDEDAHVVLMRLYLRSGKPKSALNQFAELQRALATYDDHPSEYAIKFRDRAQERLANLSDDLSDEDDDVLATPDVKKATTSPSSFREEVRTNLPRVLSTFRGRQSELEQIVRGIGEENHRLTTITGLGGSGKSRLAIEVGWQLHGRYQSRVVFVSLAALDESGEVVQELARTILGDQGFGEDPMEEAAAFLARFERVCIIVDNAEHVVDAAREAIHQLLERTDSLAILATSRLPLGLEGENLLPLGPLSLPEAGESLTEVAANPAIALFVDRAQSVKADFQLTERTTTPILELCAKLEGLPLALELAAGWARVLTPAQMLEQIERNVDALASRRKDISPRHRSLRAAFDGTYALLGDRLRALFQRLTFFSGSWDLQAAQHLCPDEDVLTAHQELEERSLIFAAPTEHEMRYSMLETVRSFGEGHVTPDLYAECGWRHAEFFLGQAEAALPFQAWAPIIEVDYPNHIAALRWLQENGDVTDFCRYTAALGPFWEGMGRLQEGLGWLTQATNSTALDPVLAARNEAALGRIEWLLGQFERANERLGKALQIFEIYDAEDEAMDARFALHAEAHRSGDYDQARSLLSVNLAIAERKHHFGDQARCLIALGNAAIEQEDWESAEGFYEESLKRARLAGEHDRIGAALTNLANLAIYRERFEAAEAWISEALGQMKESSYRWRYAMSLIIRARLANAKHEYAEAIDFLARALGVAADEKLVFWRVALQLGVTFAGLGQTADAIRAFGFVERIRKNLAEEHRGIELRTFDAIASDLKAKVDESEFEENYRVGFNYSDTEIDRMLARAKRFAAGF